MEWPDLTFPPLNLYNFPRQSFLYDKGNTMQITLTDTNGTYSISTVEDFVSLEEIIALLVKPILLAASFSESQLNEYFVKEDEFKIIFEDWDDDEEEEEDCEDEVAANAALEEPMEKVVCKKEVVATPKIVAKAPATVAPKEVFSKAPVEKKAVAKMATARMAV